MPLLISIADIVFHLVSAIISLLSVVFRTKWFIYLYMIVIVLEIPFLWRVLGTEVRPVWLNDPISLTLGVIIYLLPFLRWVRTRSLLTERREKIALGLLLTIHLVGGGHALWKAFENSKIRETVADTNSIRSLAIGNNQSEMEAIVESVPSDEQPAMRANAIKASLTYSKEELSVSLAEKYPEATTVQHLVIAIEGGKLVFIQEVLGKRPELLNELKASGVNPLIAAIQAEENDVLFALLDYTNPTEKDEEGQTVLMHAARKADYKLVKTLVEKWPEAVKDRDLQGRSPLMHAAGWRGEIGIKYDKVPEIVTLLVNKGAEVNAKDNNGQTAIAFALKWPTWSTQPETVKILREAGATIPETFDPNKEFVPMRTMHLENLNKEEQTGIWGEVLESLDIPN